jgi:hypothetical protein
MLFASFTPGSFESLPSALDTLGMPAGVLIGLLLRSRLTRPR